MREMMNKQDFTELPTTEALEAELKRVQKKNRYQFALRRTVYILITVAAAAVLLATLFLPVMRIYGTSMSPTMHSGDVTVAIKNSDIDAGDVIAFYHNNKILVKRVIGRAGDWIDIDAAGTVSVNGTELEEPYLSSRALGDANVEFPYQVPEGRFFVMGDHRETSIDSRNTAVGCVSQEQIVGKIVWRVWPIAGFGMIR